MRSELQSLVDSLAERTDAPAVLTDCDQRIVSYSAHGGPIDDLRRESILRRRVRPSAVARLRESGAFHSTEAVRIPGHSAGGVLPRLCVPLRHREQFLGFVLLIDDRDCLTAGSLAPVAPTLERLSLLLYDDQVTRVHTDRVLSQLLSPVEELREAAARRAVDDGLVPPNAPVVVLVARPAVPAGREHARQALWDLAHESGSGPGEALRLVHGDHAVLLARVQQHDEAPAAGLAARVHRALCRRLAEPPDAGNPGRRPTAPLPRAVVGVGEVYPRLAGAALSYRQARLAARVAALVPSVGEVARWRALGAFRVLAQLPSDEAAEAALDPRLLTLLRTGDTEAVRTLETYLDLACDAKATAERLYLHRATLYYRLGKVERLCGIDLHDGHDRLAIHLSLKLSRLTGLYPAG